MAAIPLRFFQFLTNFVRGCNAYDISEGMAVSVIQDFVKGGAKTFLTQYCRSTSDQQPINDNLTYIKIVDKPIRQYATDDQLTRIKDKMS